MGILTPGSGSQRANASMIILAIAVFGLFDKIINLEYVFFGIKFKYILAFAIIWVIYLIWIRPKGI